MEPKAIRPVQKNPIHAAPYGAGLKDDGSKEDQKEVVPVKKSESTYEKRLEKMSNRQLRHEIKRGIRGDLTGYRSVAESVVLDVILKSFGEGMSPFIR